MHPAISSGTSRPTRTAARVTTAAVAADRDWTAEERSALGLDEFDDDWDDPEDYQPADASTLVADIRPCSRLQWVLLACVRPRLAPTERAPTLGDVLGAATLAALRQRAGRSKQHIDAAQRSFLLAHRLDELLAWVEGDAAAPPPTICTIPGLVAWQRLDDAGVDVSAVARDFVAIGAALETELGVPPPADAEVLVTALLAFVTASPPEPLHQLHLRFVRGRAHPAAAVLLPVFLLRAHLLANADTRAPLVPAESLVPADPVLWHVYTRCAREARSYSSFDLRDADARRPHARIRMLAAAGADEVLPENVAEAVRLASLPPRRLLVTARNAAGVAGFISGS